MPAFFGISAQEPLVAMFPKLKTFCWSVTVWSALLLLVKIPGWLTWTMMLPGVYFAIVFGSVTISI